MPRARVMPLFAAMPLLLVLSHPGAAHAQLGSPAKASGATPLTSSPATPYKLVPFSSPPPALSPGVVLLTDLETRFQQAIATGGGKAFADWFADDAVALNNGKPALLGRGAIAANANWDPKTYTLRWIVQGAQMGPSGDMGYTWGHYETRAHQPAGPPVIKTGRYMTIWRKEKDGAWKVVLDASSDEGPGPPPCCFVTGEDKP